MKGRGHLKKVAPTFRSWCILLLFFSLGFAVYGSALRNKFVFDDEVQITGNQTIQDWRNIPRLFLTSTNQVRGADKLDGVYYKPLMTTAFALLWTLDGANPAVFHGFQIALHSFCAWLLWLLLRRFMDPLTAAALAGVYLVHPMNVEVAIYSADLQEVLFVAFGLGALLVTTAPGTAWTVARATLLGALLLSSLLSKESGILFYLAVAAAMLKAQSPRSKQSRNSLVRLHRAWLAWGTAGASYALLRMGALGLWPAGTHNWARIAQLPLSERLFSLPMIIVHYFRLFFWPDRLVAAQDWVIRSAAGSSFWLPLLLAVGTGTAVAWFLASRLRDANKSLFTILLVSGLALHSQIFPLDGTVADRWFCVPMIGLLGLSGIAWESFPHPEPRVSRIAATLLLVALCVLSFRSMARTRDWRDGEALFLHDVALDPENGLLQNNAGVELYRRGRLGEALARFEKAVRLSPHWTIPWNNFGALLEADGRDIEAEKAYRTSVSLGIYDLAFENYPRLLIKLGKFREAREFITNTGLVALPGNSALLAMKAALLEAAKPAPPGRGA